MAQYNTNTTTGLSNHLMAYLEKRFLSRLLVKFHFEKGAMKRKLGKNQGKTIKFNRWANLAEDVTPLDEGVVKDAASLSSSNQTATIYGYGQWATTSDFLILTAINDQMNDMVDLLGYAAGKSMDALLRNEVDANGTSQIGSALANVAAVQADATAVLKSADIRNAARALHGADVEPFENGLFKMFVHPFCEFDLLGEAVTGNTYIGITQYTSSEDVKQGKIGQAYGVELFRTSHIRTEDDALASGNTNVYRNVICGQEGYGVIDLESAGLEMIINQLGSGGSSDPLKQIATVGYKFYEAVKLLDATRVRVVKVYAA